MADPTHDVYRDKAVVEALAEALREVPATVGLWERGYDLAADRLYDAAVGAGMQEQSALCNDIERDRDQLRELLDIWLTGDCPMYDERCRVNYLCGHCFENAAIDFDLEVIPDRSTK